MCYIILERLEEGLRFRGIISKDGESGETEERSGSKIKERIVIGFVLLIIVFAVIQYP